MTGPLTIDASVFVRATNSLEPGHEECEEVVRLLGSKTAVVVLPTLAIPELAGALGRRRMERSRVDALMDRIRRMPTATFVALDDALAEEAAELAIQTRLRGADAVYVATARRYGTTLITVDEEQRQRVPPDVTAILPTQFLEALGSRSPHPTDR
jgi:predicted nucleic acid-binding protein